MFGIIGHFGVLKDVNISFFHSFFLCLWYWGCTILLIYVRRFPQHWSSFRLLTQKCCVGGKSCARSNTSVLWWGYPAWYRCLQSLGSWCRCRASKCDYITFIRECCTFWSSLLNWLKHKNTPGLWFVGYSLKYSKQYHNIPLVEQHSIWQRPILVKFQNFGLVYYLSNDVNGWVFMMFLPMKFRDCGAFCESILRNLILMGMHINFDGRLCSFLEYINFNLILLGIHIKFEGTVEVWRE